jgi:beta-lactamase class A
VHSRFRSPKDNPFHRPGSGTPPSQGAADASGFSPVGRPITARTPSSKGGGWNTLPPLVPLENVGTPTDINAFYHPSASAPVPGVERRRMPRVAGDGTHVTMRRAVTQAVSSEAVSVSTGAGVVPYFQKGKRPPKTPFALPGVPTHKARNRFNRLVRSGFLMLVGLLLCTGLGWMGYSLFDVSTTSAPSPEAALPSMPPAEMPVSSPKQNPWQAPVLLDAQGVGHIASRISPLNLLPTFSQWPASQTPWVPLLAPVLSAEQEQHDIQALIDAAVLKAPAALRPHIMMMDGQTLQYAGYRMHEPVPSASVIKLPLLYLFGVHVNAGTRRPQDAVYFDERHRVSGSGSWQGDPAGNFRSALQTAEVMIQNSDNCATEMMIDYLGGKALVNQQFRGIGMQATRVRNILPDKEGFNTISPYEMVQTLLQIKEHPYFTDETRALMMNILEGTRNRTILPALLPPDTLVAHKTGDIGKSLGESGLIYLPDGRYYYLSMMVERPHNDPAAKVFMQTLSKAIWDYYQAQRPAAYVAVPPKHVAGAETPPRDNTAVYMETTPAMVPKSSASSAPAFPETSPNTPEAPLEDPEVEIF